MNWIWSQSMLSRNLYLLSLTSLWISIYTPFGKDCNVFFCHLVEYFWLQGAEKTLQFLHNICKLNVFIYYNFYHDFNTGIINGRASLYIFSPSIFFISCLESSLGDYSPVVCEVLDLRPFIGHEPQVILNHSHHFSLHHSKKSFPREKWPNDQSL